MEQTDSKEYLEAIREMNNEEREATPVNAVHSTANPQPQANQMVLVSIDKQGVVGFKNQIELSQAASFVIQMKLAPDHLRKEGKEMVMAALTLCRQYGLPLSALNEIAAIKGKVGVFGSLVTALAQRHPEYGDLKVQYVNEKQEVICLANKNLKDDVWACVISVRKKGADEWNEYFFTRDEAKTAGLLSNNTYQKYFKDMSFHRAKFRAMQTEYASALKGIESAENLSYEAAVKDVSPAEEMNIKLGLRKGPESNEQHP